MEAHEVTPANLSLAVGGILTELRGITRRLDQQDIVLSEIRTQTIKTNGRVNAAEGAIAECKVNVREALAKACPGKCVELESKVRSLEDSRIASTSTIGGISWAGRALIGVGTAAVSVIAWYLAR